MTAANVTAISSALRMWHEHPAHVLGCHKKHRQDADATILMLKLNRQLCDEMTAHGERDYPYECCGLLLGHNNEPTRKQLLETYPISNAREEAAKRNRFLIRPEELLRGEKYAATRDLDVIGFYHSHPDHPAVPSQYDLEHAWPLYSYIVIAVRQGKLEAIRSWEMETDRSKFIEEELLNIEEVTTQR